VADRTAHPPTGDRRSLTQIVSRYPVLVTQLDTREHPIWQRIDVRGATECWPWTRGTTTPGGYGVLRVAGRPVRAHRFVYELVNGALTPGLYVLHSCDNPPCCNPAHLRQGTHAENMQDKIDHRRERAVVDLGRDGSELHRLTAEREVVERAIAAKVTDLRAAGFSWAYIAAELGCSKQAAQQRYGPVAPVPIKEAKGVQA
jgi:hypothetical protein